MKMLIATGVLVLAPSMTMAEETESRVWTETFAVTTPSPRLSIDNIWGSVRVRTGGDGEITITVDEHRSAPDQAMLERSRTLLKLDTFADANGVSIKVGERDRRSRFWDHCEDCRVDYQFDVVVPKGSIVSVGTVMDGTIDVSGVHGQVSASNVNGPVTVADALNCDRVENVNGRVELSFAGAPGKDCSIETINGDVMLRMPPGSGLDVSLDIFNGNIVSEFATDTYVLPAEVHYEEKQGINRYRLHQSAGLRLEGGGPTFSISSMNGDVQIQQN